MLTTYCLGVLTGVVGMLVLQHGWGWVLAMYHSVRGKL